MDDSKKTAYVIFAGILARLAFWLTTPVTGDALFHFSIARYMAQKLSVPTFEYVTGPDPFWYPPLFHVITAIVYRITGVLTLTPLVFGIAGLVMFSVFCQRFYPKVAFSATLCLAFLPFHVYYSSIGYFETLLFFLAVCAYFFYFGYLRKPNDRDLAYTACMCALLAWTHYYGFVVMISVGAHLFIRNPKAAVSMTAVALLLACPWYARNYAIFGNPVWPKIYGGNYPNDKTTKGASLSASALELATATKWTSVFFDFWIGAPNSGEDVWSNAQRARQRYPMFDIFMLPWLVFIIGLSALAVSGAYTFRADEKALLALMVLAISIVPFLMNGLARVFVSFVPFAVIAMAAGFHALKFRYKHLLVAAAFIGLMGGSYAYAYTYRNIRDPYLPFFDEMRQRIAGGANVVMPFNIQDCVYFSQRKCLRIGNTGGIPTPTKDTLDSIITDYGVEYVCCSSLNIQALSDSDRLICQRFEGKRPYIDYEAQGVWGKCWGT